MEEVVVHGEKEKGESWAGKDLDPLKNNGHLSSFLENAGGVETQGMGGAKTFSQASIRGSSPEQTLILLNGQRMNQGFDLGLIPTDDIERIEVLKGPAALAYGSEAMGGAINVITRPKEGGASLGALGGDFNTWQVQGSTGGWNAGAWSGSLGGSWYQTDGYTLNTDGVSGELNQESQWSLGDDQLSLQAGYVYKNGGAPNGDSLSAKNTGQFDTDDREKRNAVEASLSADRKAGDWEWKPSFNYGFADVERLNPLGADNAAGVPVKDQNIYNHFSVKAEGSAQWSGPLSSLDLSLEYRAQAVQGAEGLAGGARWDNVAAFSAMGQWEWGKDLALNWGGRLDWYQAVDAVVFNPEGTLKLKFAPGKDLTLGAGTGYRRPDFNELFHPAIAYVIGTDTPVEFGKGESGNPNLLPESSVNLEVGTDLLFGEVLLRLSGFTYFYSNLIVPGQDGTGYWIFLNISRALLLGGEAGVKWSPWEWVSLSGDYTYVDSRDTDSGQLIPARLRQKLSAGLALEPVKNLELNLKGLFVDHNPALYNGPQDSPPLVVASSYWVMSAGLKWEAAKDLKFFMNLDNLFNRTFATVQGLPMPGRTMELGTTVRF